MTIIKREDGKILCKDEMWREFTTFGTFSSCIKTYKLQGRAERKVRRMNAVSEYCAIRDNKPFKKIEAVTIPPNHSMDVTGRIYPNVE